MLHLDPFTVGSTALRREDIVLCHDVGPITHPELFEPHVCKAYEAIYNQIATVRPNVVFVSHASQRAYGARYNTGPSMTGRVIYPAIHIGNRAAPVAPRDFHGKPFLLTVGSIGDRKNQISCIAAFERSGLSDRGFHYVMCGSREPGFEAAARAAEQTPGVVMFHYLTDAELSWLYQHACGFILASRLEGFGLPVAEAIGHGLVPAITKASALEEVAGDAALLIDADDIDDIAAAMCRLAAMGPAEREDRKKVLLRSIDRFSPDRFIEQWRILLREVLGREPERLISSGAARETQCPL
ncbi:glycosyltransferase [Sphingomonas natans]|uniref:glycosyltransferase n=1 Tax=Sphingomonas natans TaxID=3063330 RepID=UPI0026E37FBF|nr:glycosyltransferase [Sphingomonas sp. BIUV-7]